MLLALSLTLLVAASAAAAAARRVAGAGFPLAVYLLAVAQIVLLTELLSLAGWVGRWGYLGGQLVLTAAALAWWNAAGRPRVSLPRVDLRAAAARHPVVAALAIVVAVAFVYQTFLAFSVPPTTWDALTYHLARAAGWYQVGAVEYLDAHTARVNVNPPNGEIQILYTFAFLGRDVLAAVPQLLAELVLVLAVYGCARRLGYGRAPSAFAALLLATLTQFALQATSTQNDLVAAAPVACAAYFVLGRRSRELPLAGLAVGLALGTKLTVIIVVPGLALLAALVLTRRKLAHTAAAALAGFALVGAYGYVLNTLESGNPRGDSPEEERFRPELTARGVVSTPARIGWDFVDLSGFNPPVALQETLEESVRWWFESLHIHANPREATSTHFSYGPNTSVDEDMSYFGPLGALLVLPLGIGFALAFALRRVDGAHGALALSLPLFVVTVALTYKYNPWVGRYMTLPVALVLPLAAWLYQLRVVAAAAAALGAATLLVAHVYNGGKPLSEHPWSQPRIEVMTKRHPDLRRVLTWFEQRVPDDAPVGVNIGVDDWAYPFYGERLGREVAAVDGLADARRRGIEWVVYGPEQPDPRDTGGAYAWRGVKFPPGWRVYYPSRL